MPTMLSDGALADLQASIFTSWLEGVIRGQERHVREKGVSFFDRYRRRLNCRWCDHIKPSWYGPPTCSAIKAVPYEGQARKCKLYEPMKGYRVLPWCFYDGTSRPSHSYRTTSEISSSAGGAVSTTMGSTARGSTTLTTTSTPSDATNALFDLWEDRK